MFIGFLFVQWQMFRLLQVVIDYFFNKEDVVVICFYLISKFVFQVVDIVVEYGGFCCCFVQEVIIIDGLIFLDDIIFGEIVYKCFIFFVQDVQGEGFGFGNGFVQV